MITDTVLNRGTSLAQNGTTTTGAGGSVSVSWELVVTIAIVGSIALAVAWLFSRNAGSS